jgi:hypothetical protein
LIAQPPYEQYNFIVFPKGLNRSMFHRNIANNQPSSYSLYVVVVLFLISFLFVNIIPEGEDKITY